MKKLPGRSSPSQSRKSRLASAGAITDVPGIRVGHAHDLAARTGCTVVLCGDAGAVAGVDVRGAAPGTRETDLLAPENLVERVHAVLLTGGSVFGLDAACGVVGWLEARGVGFDTGVARVPIVPAAVIFDLAEGDAQVRPDARMGYAACERASDQVTEEGRVGAGAGATVGKALGITRASAGGIGMASMTLASNVTVGALVVVNAFGDIVDPASGHILAGARSPRGGWLDTQRLLESGPPASPLSVMQNTTLAVVATDAALTKAQARKVAAMAHDGLARAIKPIHTMFDGDTIFALSTGDRQADVTTIGAVAAETVARAVVRVGRMSRAG
ncbi:MAG TPA: P1 family peptidase [Blastocatellia bacterium]|nr:P1 family peptidase [Blastocatellia bacterium]